VAWRGVLLSRAARLSLDRACCLVETEEGPIRLAFEDVAYLVLDTPQAVLTSALLARFAEAGVLVLTCDGKHLPNGALLPLQGHFRQVATLRRQLAASEGLKKRLWQRLVQGKVANQGRVLRLLGRPGAAGLLAMAERVAPGDPEQIEARSAREYFRRLFPRFRRRHDDPDPRNAMLNYAYALLRAGLARGLAAQGFHPAIGLWHASVDNAFNLADDLIEPFRPLADLHVARHAERRPDGGDELTVLDRRELARLLVAELRLGGEIVTMVTAIERMADGLLAALERKDPALLPLPEPLGGGDA
jgi:CRISPR-associated protein Cas1